MSVISQLGGSSSIKEMSVYARVVEGPWFFKANLSLPFLRQPPSGSSAPAPTVDVICFWCWCFNLYTKTGYCYPYHCTFAWQSALDLFLDFFFLSLFQFRRSDLLLFVPPRFPGDIGNPLRHARKRSCLSSQPADREMRITPVFFYFYYFIFYLFIRLFVWSGERCRTARPCCLVSGVVLVTESMVASWFSRDLVACFTNTTIMERAGVEWKTYYCVWLPYNCHP
jgi:hypothetical protein